MPPDGSFPDLVRRVRARDSEAAEELFRRFEPQVRRYIRVRLTDPNIRRAIDSVDICQSVWGNFFVRVVGGQFDLDSPEQAVRLLVTMARNKLTDMTRQRRHTAPRDVDATAMASLLSGEESPSQAVAREELQRLALARLTAEERDLAGLRAQGLNWQQIAQQSGRTPEAVRKQLERAIDRVCDELGIDQVNHA